MATPGPSLVTLSLGFFMTLLDMTIVNIAIPNVMSDLHTGLDQVMWTVSGYTSSWPVLLVTAARLGDMRGQRALFAAGVAVFTAAGAVCDSPAGPGPRRGTAGTGAGGGTAHPADHGPDHGVFPAGRRGTALGVWGSVAGVATLSGRRSADCWSVRSAGAGCSSSTIRSRLLVLALTLLFVPDLRTGRAHRLDLPGALLSTTSLTCVTFALMEGDRYSWNAGILALGAAGLAFAALFLRGQARRQESEPLVPFRLFADRGFTVMTGLVGAIGAALIAAVLPLGLYFQQQLGFSAAHAGLALALPLVSLFVSPLAGRLSDGSAAAVCCWPGWCPFCAGLLAVILLAQASASALVFTVPLMFMASAPAA